jgi:hypothetical protein
VDWIVIDDSKSNMNFGFGLSVQFFQFSPNPKGSNFFLSKIEFSWCIMIQPKSQAILVYIISEKCLVVKL